MTTESNYAFLKSHLDAFLQAKEHLLRAQELVEGEILTAIPENHPAYRQLEITARQIRNARTNLWKATE